jgi:hypothetical protein
MYLAHGEPAAGAAAGELIVASIVGLALLVVLALFGAAHRSGRTRILTRGGALAERITGLPAWASVPAAVAGGALLIAVFGFYWDVATHIDNGRDAGPFANPSHFLIIGGLGGIALAGYLSILIGSGDIPTSVRIRDGWRAPMGGVLMLVCGGIAVLGFPLDDVWHRLFGQDVTLWSPTHMQMVGGASLSTLALWIVTVEGRRAAGSPGERGHGAWMEALAAGALLLGISAFHAEFDYSVPQFRLLYQPVLLMSAAGIALVAARIRLGRFGAFRALALFLLVRSILSVVVGPIMGHTTLHFPLYIVEAIIVELVATRVSTDRQLTFGVVCGAALGTVGLAAEWAWTHVWMTMAWPSALLPEGVIFGFVAAVAGGALGGVIARSFAAPKAPRQHIPVTAGIATGVALLAVLVLPFPSNADLEARASISLADPGAASSVVEVELDPPDIAEGAEWFNVTAWQGGGSVVEPLEPLGDGRYRTSAPIPLHGEWKALLRLQRGASIVAVPIFLPRDPAIPAPEVAAEDGVTREFILDKKILLREAKEVDRPLTITAAVVMTGIALLWAATLGWGLYRLGTKRAAVRRSLRADLVTST